MSNFLAGIWNLKEKRVVGDSGEEVAKEMKEKMDGEAMV